MPDETLVVTANWQVDALFAAAGYRIAAGVAPGLTPHELIARIVAGQAWKDESHDVPAQLRAIFGQSLCNDDGKLSASTTSCPGVLPCTIVDKGCGTSKLLVDLGRRFPGAAPVGVDLSRELLRRSDENTYAGGDVRFILGDAAEAQLHDGSADTIIFSSIMHEIYSYDGYRRQRIAQALASAARELRCGGRVLIRDGVSPEPAMWRLTFGDAETRARFDRFAREFKHGAGASFRALGPFELLLNAHEANEFSFKKDYVVSRDIEVHEEYGVLTIRQWKEALAAAGCGVLEARGYVKPWIAAHRYRGHVARADERGAPLPWPDTNVVVVGEKR